MNGVSPFLAEKTRRKASSHDVDEKGRLAESGGSAAGGQEC